MPFKKLTILLLLAFITTINAGDFSSKVQNSFSVKVLVKEAEKALDEASLEFYDNLPEALSRYFMHHDKGPLKRLPKKFYEAQIISVLLQKLRFNQIVQDNQIIRIIDERLGQFEFNLFQLVNYVAFICKITYRIMKNYDVEEMISLLSDNVFSNPLLLFLLVSSLNELGYHYLTINLLTKKETNYEKVINRISTLNGINCSINQYPTLVDLINSNNKIDVYISNLTFPQEQNYFKCIRNKTSQSDLITKPIDRTQIFVTYSKVSDTTLCIATKLEGQKNRNLRNDIFKKLIQELQNPTERFNNTIINKYECKLLPSAEGTLADIIYLTHQKSDKAPVPLFLYYYNERDTKAGIVAKNVIIETLLSNLHNYKELLSSLLKSTIGLTQKDIEGHSSNLQAFNFDRATNSFSVYKDGLNNLESIVKTFLRKNKIIAPSIIDVL